MSDLQIVEFDGRLNTGPVAVKGDWPGFFFRGDEAPVCDLRIAAKLLRDDPAQYGESIAARLEALAARMAQCESKERA